MKQFLILFSVLGLGVFSALGQASINGENEATTPLQVEDPAINGGVFVNVGQAAANAGFLGAGPGQVTISMYAAKDGTPLATLEAGTPIATIQNSPSTLLLASGIFDFGNPFTLPTVGKTFDGSGKIEIVFFGISTLTDGHQYSGWSTEGTGIVPATGATIPATIFGSDPGLINSFLLSPVPDQSSTMALSGLSAAALLFFGRRKAA